MINYKMERVLFIIIWIGLICFFSFAIPPQTITLLIQYQYAASSLILTFFVFYLYVKIRNRKIINKINRHLISNEFDLCYSYLEKCIRAYPKLFWLKFQKLMFLALKGEITDFTSYAEIIKNDKRVHQKGYLDTITNFEILFDFLVNGQIKCICGKQAENSYIEKMINLICNKETSPTTEVVSIALEVYNAPYRLYKSISAAVLANIYLSLGDLNNAKLFEIKAKEFAPSNETLYCVKKLLGN